MSVAVQRRKKINRKPNETEVKKDLTDFNEVHQIEIIQHSVNQNVIIRMELSKNLNQILTFVFTLRGGKLMLIERSAIVWRHGWGQARPWSVGRAHAWGHEGGCERGRERGVVARSREREEPSGEDCMMLRSHSYLGSISLCVVVLILCVAIHFCSVRSDFARSDENDPQYEEQALTQRSHEIETMDFSNLDWISCKQVR